MLGPSYLIHYSVYSINIHHIEWNIMLLSYATVDFHLFYDEPFWQEVSVESLILRWPLRPFDLLLIKCTYPNIPVKSLHKKNAKFVTRKDRCKSLKILVKKSSSLYWDAQSISQALIPLHLWIFVTVDEDRKLC